MLLASHNIQYFIGVTECICIVLFHTHLYYIYQHHISYIIIPQEQYQGKKKKKKIFLHGDTSTSKVDYYTSIITPLCSKWT